jgi:hypothetical protein
LEYRFAGEQVAEGPGWARSNNGPKQQRSYDSRSKRGEHGQGSRFPQQH